MAPFRFLHCCVVLLSLLVASHAGAETPSSPLHIVGDQYEAPRIYLDGDTPRGTLIDILDYVERKTGLNFRIDLYPWARAYETARRGQAAIIGLSKTAERLAWFDYSVPIYFEDILVVSLASDPVGYAAIADLDGRTVGVVRAGVYGDAFEQARSRKAFAVKEDNNSTQRLKLLLHGRIDVALVGSGKAGLQYAINQDAELRANQRRFHVARQPIVQDPNYIGFPKTMAAATIIGQINDAITEGYASGELQQIVDNRKFRTNWTRPDARDVENPGAGQEASGRTRPAR